MTYAPPLELSDSKHSRLLFTCVNVLRCIVVYLIADAKIECVFN